MINTLMVILFPYLDFIPFAVPRYLLFKDRLRIPFRYIVALMITVSTAYSLIFYYVNLDGYANAAKYTTLIRYGFMLINLILSFGLIRDTFPRLMYTYLLLVSWSFFVFGNANFIESTFFMEFSDAHPYLIYNLGRIVVLIITYPFMLRFLKNTVAEALKIDEPKIWRYMWKIPLFSTLFGMLYCTVSDVYAFTSWQFMVSRYLMLFGTCYVSYVVLKVLNIAHDQLMLKEALKYADMSLMAQKKQMDVLTSHMVETRKARHDLRQHLAVIQSYIDSNDKDALQEYIHVYQKELPPDTVELYSRNDVVNAIVCYYASLARSRGIQFEARLAFPKHCPVTDTDITVLLGNLLENAVEACAREPLEKPSIRLRIRTQYQNLFILVDNTCTHPVTFQGDTPQSSKRQGPGIGIASIREIAQRYHGITEFKVREQMFCASVMLRMH